MANDILTPLMITRESLRVLHQSSNFIGNVNRQYDDRFAQSGAKIGQLLNIRMPPKYSVRTGAALAVQDHVERSTPLSVSSQYGVDVSFTSVELTMDLDDFSDRFLKPAMSQLAAQIESDCFQAAYKLVNNYSNASTDTTLDYSYFQKGDANLTRNLAPRTDRSAILTPDSRVAFSTDVKGLFQSAENIKQQYREGIVGRTGGEDVFENTLLPYHTTGTLAGSPVTDGANQGISATTNVWASQTDVSITGADTGTTILAGDIITFGTATDGIVSVHPESKALSGKLQTFVAQADVTMTTPASTYVVTVKPALIYGSGNAFQNCALVTTADTDGLAVGLIGSVGTQFGQDLQFHKDAFVFATADLEDVSQYGAWGARDTQDGISMRIAKQYDINSDAVPCRIDVLWGFGGLYPELANRHMYDNSLV